MDFNKWNKAIDADAINKELEDIEKNGGSGEYREVPIGNYIVKIEKMELKESKKGDPMFSAMFRIREGEFENSCLFMNQIVLQAFQIHIVNEFLKSLETDVDVKFTGNYADYNDMILDVMEAVEREHLEFDLKYGERKGFKTFSINDIFEV